MCFNGVVWNIQCILNIPKHVFIETNKETRTVVHASFDEPLNFTSGTRTFKKRVPRFVLNRKGNRWRERVNALVSGYKAGARRASQVALEPSSCSAEELQVKRRLRLRLWTTEGSAAAPGR